jgi:hypothetical protein
LDSRIGSALWLPRGVLAHAYDFILIVFHIFVITFVPPSWSGSFRRVRTAVQMWMILTVTKWLSLVADSALVLFVADYLRSILHALYWSLIPLYLAAYTPRSYGPHVALQRMPPHLLFLAALACPLFVISISK